MINTKGFGLIKAVIVFLIIIVVVYAGFEFASVYFAYFSIKDTMKEAAKFDSLEPNEVIVKKIMDKAKELNMPILEEDIHIEKYPGYRIIIGITYEVSIKFLYYTHRFKFEPAVEAAMPEG